MHARRLEPEWLDTLPERDVRAQHSRRDLVRINALMGNSRIVAGLLRRCLGERPRIAEIGAGDGLFAASIVRRLAPVGEVILVDRAAGPSPAAREAIAGAGWRMTAIRADVFAWLEDGQDVDAVFANLFLHHFDDAQLATMLAAIARRIRAFVACEPRRSRFALAGSSLLGLIGCNDVTCHDAVVSVRAGFGGEEIRALWPRDGRFRIEERARGVFSHAFSAVLA